MICLSCHREIGEVLMLSHGKNVTLCPLCKRDPTGADHLFITEENEELCRLSEQYYYRWLTSQKSKKDEQNYLVQALKSAERSAQEGNPRATVWLGFFYDKDYLGEDFGEVQRCRIAYNYYRKIIDHKETFRGEIEKLGYDESASQSLRVKAATYLLDMLASAPDELTREPAYSFERNRAEICAKLHISYSRTEHDRTEEDKGDQLFHTLTSSCFSRDRAPLLGISRMTWEELKSLMSRSAREDGESKKTLIDWLHDQRVELACVSCSDDGNAGSGEFHSLKNSGGLRDVEPYMLSGGKNRYSGCVWLYFFNRRGRHRLAAKDIIKVSDAFAEHDYVLLRALIANNTTVDCTLFDDDVLCYSEHGHGWRRAVEKLCENIGGNIE